MDEAAAVAAKAAAESQGRRPERRDASIGPVVSKTQFNKIQRLIQAGIDEGATARHRRPGPARGPRHAATTCARPCSPT